jgi:hypothetical protein
MFEIHFDPPYYYAFIMRRLISQLSSSAQAHASFSTGHVAEFQPARPPNTTAMFSHPSRFSKLAAIMERRALPQKIVILRPFGTSAKWAGSCVMWM